MSVTNLLPPNASPGEVALQTVTSQPIANLDLSAIDGVWNPMTCPVALLPWLAWALCVDSWDSSWDESVKRATVAQSISVLKVKGTIGALKRALGAVGYSATVIEYPATPFTFSVSLDVSGGSGGSAVPYAAAQSIALLVKNVRSKLIAIDAALAPSTPTAQYGTALSLGVNLSVSM